MYVLTREHKRLLNLERLYNSLLHFTGSLKVSKLALEPFAVTRLLTTRSAISLITPSLYIPTKHTLFR